MLNISRGQKKKERVNEWMENGNHKVEWGI